MSSSNGLELINFYADESHHLKGQGPNMVLGAIWCERRYVSEASDKIALVRAKHNIAAHREIKWTKVSSAKTTYYQELVRLFFELDGLNFRAVVIPTGHLHHETFDQTQEDFYYKMQYIMLKNVIRKKKALYKVYLDYKDSWSNQRSQELADYLAHTADFSDRSFSAQPVRSYESALLQLADLFIGAVAAKNDGQPVSDAKRELIQAIEKYALQGLDEQSPIGVDKVNIFKWQPQAR